VSQKSDIALIASAQLVQSASFEVSPSDSEAKVVSIKTLKSRYAFSSHGAWLKEL